MPAPVLPRDAAMLRHIARYRIGLLAVLSKLFFDGQDAGRVLGVLRKDTPGHRPLVKVHSRALKNSLSYATLTAAGFEAAGLRLNRCACEALGPAALSKAIALLVFCCLATHRRHRLDRSELRQAFGANAPPDNVFHIVSDELGWPAIFRVVFATSIDRRQIERINKHVSEARANPAIRPWLEAGDYGLAVLVPWPTKVEATRELIAESRVSSDVPFLVDCGPNAETLPLLLKKG